MAQPFLPAGQAQMSAQEAGVMAAAIESCLKQYQVPVRVADYSQGAVFTVFRAEPGPGIRAAQVAALIPELCRILCVTEIHIIPFIPGTPYLGILVAARFRRTAPFAVCYPQWTACGPLSPLSVLFGEDLCGRPAGADLAALPHLMIAGTTGSGKSMLQHALLISLLYRCSPAELRLILCDTGQLEFSLYHTIPHLLFPVATDTGDALRALEQAETEMQVRLRLLASFGVRSRDALNERLKLAESFGRPIPDPRWRPGLRSDAMDYLRPLPVIVLCLDDYVQVMAEHKDAGERLIALSRSGPATGIHLVLASRSPLPAAVFSQLRVHIPARIALTVTSKADSQLILDCAGAEGLTGNGDMLFMAPGLTAPQRIHGAYVTDEDIRQAIAFCARYERPEPENRIVAAECHDPASLDPLFDDAVLFVAQTQRVSVSGIQRQFRIGYNRAARIAEALEELGFISEPDHRGTRHVLIPASGKK